MTQPDMDVIKEIPGYKLILKSVLKSQIQQLVDQLSAYTDEESVILTANMSDGTLSHLGSDYGKFFLENDDSMKSKFLKFCIKVHQVKEQEKKAEESLRKLATPSPLVLQLSSPSLTGNTQKSPKSRPTKQQHPYPVNMFKASPKPKGQGASRYEPYRKILPKAAEKKSDVPVIPDVKTEPGSMDETGESNGANSGHSPYEEKPQFGLEDDAKSNSSSSTISVDPQDMTVKDAQLGDGYDSSANLNLENISQQLDKNDSKGNLLETDRGTPRIKVEATEEDESELEITSVEPGPSSVPPQNWAPGVQSGIDQSGAATSSMVDLQGYKMTSSSSLKKDEKTLAYAHETKITVQTKESVQHMKSYTCKQCGKTFRYKSQMDKHIRIHTGERPFACDICGFSFKEKGHLRNHMITLHQNGYQ